MKKTIRVILVSAMALTMLFAPLSAFAAGNPAGRTPSSPPSGGMGPGSSGGNSAPPSGSPGGGGPGGADTMTYDYTGTLSGKTTATNEKVSVKEETIETDTVNQNATLSSEGGTLSLKNVTLNKTGDNENGDECNFYGLNSISLTTGEGSKTYISNSTLTSDSTGSNGVFASDSGTAYLNKVTIHTSKDNSRGLDATYGGTILGNKLTIQTKGDHCAALATDRGGGNLSVTNSTLKTEGNGSPLLYSTGDIEVDGVTGTATGSQLAGMEGRNTILIKNSTLKSTIKTKTASDPVADGIIIYQSTSGDAESTTGDRALFQTEDSTLTSAIESGSMFYITNTDANVVLSKTKLNFDASKAKLLLVAGNNDNGWGTAGQNGGDVNFTAIKETLKGDIEVDTISTANIWLRKGTKYTGKTAITTNTAGAAATNNLTMNVDKTSTWVVTGDSTVTNLNAAEGSKIVGKDGKKVSIIVNGETKVKGTSKYTVTVTGTYSTTVETSDVNKVSTDVISRAAFDKHFDTTTTFGTNTTAKTKAPDETAKSENKGFFAMLKEFFHIG